MRGEHSWVDAGVSEEFPVHTNFSPPSRAFTICSNSNQAWHTGLRVLNQIIALFQLL